MLAWIAIRCRVVWLAAVRVSAAAAGCGWSVARGRCRVLSPVEVDRLLGALWTQRDRAIVLAMLLAGLRRCEVLGLRLRDINAGERRLFVASGKGGRERIVPVSGRFFESLGRYLESERPSGLVTDACFVVLKGPRRGLPLSAAGLDEVIDGARGRAGLTRVSVTCLGTRA